MLPRDLQGFWVASAAFASGRRSYGRVGFRVWGGYIGIMEKKMEPIGIIGVIYRLCRDNGKEHGNFCLGFRVQGLGLRILD